MIWRPRFFYCRQLFNSCCLCAVKYIGNRSRFSAYFSTVIPGIKNFTSEHCLEEAWFRWRFFCLFLFCSTFPRCLIGEICQLKFVSDCEKVEQNSKRFKESSRESSLFQTVYWSKIYYPGYLSFSIRHIEGSKIR